MPKTGRPKEGRIRMTIHIRKDTKARICAAVRKDDKTLNTRGKVVDGRFEE